ncbi:LANO_0C06568g1_1 [Lachancea nothofagi CBS 11611]|uniref:Anaphase-promoting complex subunit 4 n=1 Tax=Lachancea nothofagi CBS 11611 TaxID=1266666 RepID=A0A1G4J822_9SACH|nr:LANO_0C06568g1_1 [Lachancea nothofagi CBS 11611]
MSTDTGSSVKWRFKGISKLGTHQEVIWNPRMALYLVATGKNVGINRAIDDQRIGTVVLKDYEQVMGFQWDQKEGKQFVVYYKHGLAKVYDCTTGGSLQKVIKLVSSQDPSVSLSTAVWAKTEWKTFDNSYAALDMDLSAMMPGMVRIVRDSKQITMAPLEPWGPDLRNPEAQIILGHSQESHSYVMTIDDLISVEFKSGVDKLFKILPPKYKHGPFVGVGEGGSLEYVYLPLTEAPLMRELIKSSGQVQFLCTYLLENIALCRSDLIEPYRLFLARITNAYDGDLYEQLCDIVLTGYVASDLEDWLCNSIGDKNYKRWKQLSSRMYGDLNNVLVLAIVPACERLILVCEKLQGIHRSLKLQKMAGISDFHEDEWDSPEIQTLLCECQKLLTTALKITTDLNREAALHSVFADWFFDVMMESVDEDYKKPARNASPFDIEQYLASCWRDASETARIALLEAMATEALVTCSDDINMVYTKPWVLDLVKVSEPLKTLHTLAPTTTDLARAPPETRLLDAVSDDAGTVFVASTTSARPGQVEVSVTSGHSTTIGTFYASMDDLTQPCTVTDASFVKCDNGVATLVILHDDTTTIAANPNPQLTTTTVSRSPLLAAKLTSTAPQQITPQPNFPAHRLSTSFPGCPLSVHSDTLMAVYEMSCEN